MRVGSTQTRTVSRRKGVVAALLLCSVVAVPEVVLGAGPSWDESWRRFGVREGVGTGAAFVVSAVVDVGLGPPDDANWRGPILVDRAARRSLATDSPTTAEEVGIASDVMTGTLMAYPFVVESGIVTTGIHGQKQTALQMALLGAESFAAASLLTVTGKRLAARERPPSEDCAAEGAHNLYCSEERYESFPSGHTSLAFTGASYICTLHEQFDLFGGGWAEPLACWTSVGVAASSGISRMISDNHYLSDVAAGAAIGVVSGYVLPKTLHFGWGSPRRAVQGRLVPGPRSLRLSISF